MLSIVCWKWKPKGTYRSTFTARHVDTLAAMVARNYANPHRMVCVTDDPEGIDRSIETVPLWDDFANVPSPHGAGNPSCYRRLKAFSAEAEQWFGPRFVCIDLDCVIVSDMSPLWDRLDDFVICGDTNPSTPYNGSMYLLRAGSRKQVWDDFDPIRSPAITKRFGYFGSDQAWIGARLGTLEHRWTAKDGVYSYRNEIAKRGGALPANARIVIFHGQHDPWCPQCQRLPWVKEHYR